MHVLERTVLVPHQPDRAPLCGLIAYVSERQPILFRRLGWEIGDDVHDGFTDALSFDNGRTWKDPQPSLRGRDLPDGSFEYFIENAGILCPDRNVFVTFTDRCVTPSKSNHTFNQSTRVRIMTFDVRPEALRAARDGQGRPASGQAGAGLPVLHDEASLFGIEQGAPISFANPIRDHGGRILVPVQWQARDMGGSLRAQGFPDRTDLRGVMQDVWQVGLLIGEFTGGGHELRWRVAPPVPCAFEKSSRGMCEGALTELPNGRLAMVMRGSNAAWPDRPSYKWLSFSDDGGESWTEAQPLPCDDGSLIESSATGSALFRSIRNGRLYWIGNLCLDGRRPNGNMPREPIYLAEVREEPFALRRSTIAEIDRRREGEDERVQHSNFKFYQDRETGDLVLFLTRYGERGSDGTDWMNADHYRYRVAVDDR